MESIKHNKMHPFLRWAGGKRWVYDSLDKLLTGFEFNSYYEPFVGGGSVLFHLHPHIAFISDSNSELINAYQQLQKYPEKIIRHLSCFEKNEHAYYILRDVVTDDPVYKAALFIYLNQMSYNGIYRVNSKGMYNVPFGKRRNYQFDLDNIRSISSYLAKKKIKCCDFQEAIKTVSSGDFVFLDPPYTITHNNNGFIQYNQKLFSLTDQYRLSNTIDFIKSKNAFYFLTNAAHSKVREIFDKGDKIIEVSRASTIGGKNAKRGLYNELIFTNLK